MKKIPLLIDMLATGFYMGKIPFMPGTFGSLVAVPVGFLCTFLPVYGKFAVFAFIFLAAIAFVIWLYTEFLVRKKKNL